jgi:hypothetical protein
MALSSHSACVPFHDPRERQPADPLDQPDPFIVAQLVFEELRVSEPKPGRYDLALLTGDDEIATQPLLIGPADVLRGDGA